VLLFKGSDFLIDELVHSSLDMTDFLGLFKIHVVLCVLDGPIVYARWRGAVAYEAL
jgi:hypothetical protein